MTTHFMLDIETLGTAPDSVVLSIGMAAFDFDLNAITDTFYRRLYVQQQLIAGASVTESTIDFWMTQPEMARQELFGEKAERVGVLMALMSLGEFVIEHAPRDRIVWANAPSFDCVILRQCGRRKGGAHQLPWEYWEERCYRTVAALFPDVPRPERDNPHHALDDAVAQAKHLLAIAHAHPDLALFRESGAA